MIKGALIGFPTGQSISHITHNALFKELQIPATYKKFDVTKHELASLVKKLKEEHYRWIAVTMPLKHEITNYIDYMKQNAHRLKTVNTILVEDNRWIGENCDGMGCLNAIEKKQKVFGKKVLVVGAGATAKAIAYEAKIRGAHVFIWNRTQIRAESIAIDLKIEPLYDLAGKFDIVINATCVGMNNNTLSVPVHLLKKTKLVMDVVYSPLETALLRVAKSIGAETVTGLEMFFELSAIQLCAVFTNWVKQDQAVEIMRNSVSMFFSDSFLGR